jgi:hypothetical protein
MRQATRGRADQGRICVGSVEDDVLRLRIYHARRAIIATVHAIRYDRRAEIVVTGTARAGARLYALVLGLVDGCRRALPSKTEGASTENNLLRVPAPDNDPNSFLRGTRSRVL